MQRSDSQKQFEIQNTIFLLRLRPKVHTHSSESTFVTEHAGNNLLCEVALQRGRTENIIPTRVNPSETLTMDGKSKNITQIMGNTSL